MLEQKKKDNWICYIIKSIDSNHTYVGATNNLIRRVNDHNGYNGISKGAKYTKGRQWYPIVFISGFENKIGCLSFESGLRHIQRKKKYKKFIYKINNRDLPIQKRIKSIFNLLHKESPLEKWHSKTLIINWLENEYNPNYSLISKNIKQNIGISNCNI
jgi:predicted GIY-YIG superfamily endonuclease